MSVTALTNSCPDTTKKASDYKQGLIYLAIGTLLFSTKGILIKLAYQYSVSPEILMSIRMLIALPFYIWVFQSQCRQGECAQLKRKQIFLTIVFGLMGYYLASWLDLTGLVYLPANLERMILYSYPGIVLILSVVFLNKKLGVGLLISLAIIYSGIAVVFLPDLLSNDNNAATITAQSNYWYGVVLVCASAAAFAIFVVGADIMMRQLSSKLFTSIAMIAASMGIITHLILTHPVSQLFSQPIEVYGYGFIIALFCTVIPSFLVAAGIKRVGAATGSLVGGIGPIATIILAWLFLGESLSVMQGFGFLIILAGISNLNRSR